MIKVVEPEGEKRQKKGKWELLFEELKVSRYYRAKLEQRRNKSARRGWDSHRWNLMTGVFQGQLIHLHQEMTVVLKSKSDGSDGTF